MPPSHRLLELPAYEICLLPHTEFHVNNYAIPVPVVDSLIGKELPLASYNAGYSAGQLGKFKTRRGAFQSELIRLMRNELAPPAMMDRVTHTVLKAYMWPRLAPPL